MSEEKEKRPAVVLELAHLKNNPGAKHRAKRVGCGIGSGHGKTSCRGGKGQTARTGSSIRPGFEGGQMPLYRRLPKRGMNSFTQEVFAVANVGDLNGFKDGDVVTPALLKSSGLVRNFESGIKILGDGELKKKLTVVANAFSASAIKKIGAADGQCLIAKMAEAKKDYFGEAALDIKKAVSAVPKQAARKVGADQATKQAAKQVAKPKA